MIQGVLPRRLQRTKANGLSNRTNLFAGSKPIPNEPSLEEIELFWENLLMRMLTIGVPTYNRINAVLRLITQFIEQGTFKVAHIVVLDDGSSDGTYGALSAQQAIINNDVRVIRNEVNTGYAKSFLRLFQECKTEYLLIMADDDMLVAENFEEINSLVGKIRPDFASPQFLINGSIYRGMSKTGDISPGDFILCCSHAPGLIYRIESCRAGLELLAARVELECAEALIYPQMVLVVSLLSNNARCFWLALPVAYEMDNSPSGIRDVSGAPYWCLESRWKQLKAIDNLLSSMLEDGSRSAVLQMIRAHRERVFSSLTIAIETECVELRSAFDKGAESYYLNRVLKRVSGMGFLRNFVRSRVSPSKSKQHCRA